MSRRRFMNEPAAAGVDDKTLLLLHFDGNYTDFSPYKRVPLSANGLSYVTGKYGDSLHVSSLATYIRYSRTWFVELFNSGVYTVDFWSKNMSNEFNSFFGVDDGTTNGFVCRAYGVTKMFEYGMYSDLLFKVAAPDLFDSLFHHYAIVSDGSRVYLFIDGVLKQSTPIKKTSFPNADFTIGGRTVNTAGVTNINYLDEFRISSVARWTSDFTPPTKPY